MSIKPDELQSLLAQCTGTEQYHRWSILFRNMVLTDGVKLLCDKTECYWLADLIASHQGQALQDPMLRDFQVWTLKVDMETRKAVAVCERDTGDVAFQQKIPFTDFPLAEMKLWVERADANLWVILLPSEH